jgi:hypothetical protein
MLRLRRRGALLAPLAAVAAAAMLAGTALAGGWATATIDGGSPPAPNAGEKTTIGFTLLQHGVTPISWEQVTLTGSNTETGESVTAQARPQGKTGHYIVEVTFPSAGTWTWRLQTRDLLMETSTFPPMTVRATGAAAAGSGSSAAAPTGVDPVLALAGLLLAFLAGAFLGSFRGDRRAEAPVAAAERLATH